MLDFRRATFLKLCDLMNYRKTAEVLDMTQPGVTQHIKYLEKEYGCSLFNYDGKMLHKTKNCQLLEKHTRSQVYNERALRATMQINEVDKVAIGATKTIGDYVINDLIVALGKNKGYEVSVLIDNTRTLLERLKGNEIDFALIEGSFDKKDYGHQLFRNELFVGVVAKGHRFANRVVELEEIFDETIILREEGSGTRAIFEQIMESQSRSIKDFNHKVTLSSFKLIEACIINGLGITFAYESFVINNPQMQSFTIKGLDIMREFNYVYLKDTLAKELVETIRSL